MTASLPSLLPRQMPVCAWAQSLIEQADWCVLDSETTGLGPHDEIIELAIVSHTGEVLFSSLLQPQTLERELATHIHGISAEMLAQAPTLPQVWSQLTSILAQFPHVLVYNVAFDHRLLTQTAARYGLLVPEGRWECVMEQYAVYHGQWHRYWQSYTWQPLSVACQTLGVVPAGQAHRALADTLDTLSVIRALAARATPPTTQATTTP